MNKRDDDKILAKIKARTTFREAYLSGLRSSGHLSEERIKQFMQEFDEINQI